MPLIEDSALISSVTAYSDVDFKDLVKEYETNDVPLDMLVMDMDWHITFYKEARQGKKGRTT